MSLRQHLLWWSVVCILVLGLVQPGQSQRLRGQAVSYADFGYIYSVAASLNTAYFATTEGVIRYDKLTQSWLTPLTGAEGLIDEVPTQIWVDKFDQKLYGEVNGSYYEYDSFFERWQPITELPPIERIDRRVGTPQILLPNFNANYMGEGNFIDLDGRRFSISEVVDDNNGNYWIGTWGFGPALAGKASTLMDLLPYGLLQNRVSTMLMEDSLIWMSGAVGNELRTGISGFFPDKNKFIQIETGVNHTIPAVDINCLEGNEKELYVGTPLGLYTLDRDSWLTRGPTGRRHGLADDNVLSLELFDSTLFVGTANGLNLVNLATDSVYQVESNTFFGQIIYDLHLIDDDLWIGSQQGAYRYNVETGRLQQFNDPDQILYTGVYKIVSYNDQLWFSSDIGLVNLDLSDGSTFAYRDQLSRGDNRALDANNSVVAFATSRGMSLLFIDKDEPYAREFGVTEGLASENVFALRLDGDYLWIGTDRGVTFFLWNNPARVD